MGYYSIGIGKLYVNQKLDEQTKQKFQRLLESSFCQRDIQKIAEKENISEEQAVELFGQEGELYPRHRDPEKETLIQPIKPVSFFPEGTCCLWNYEDNYGYFYLPQEHCRLYNYISMLNYIIQHILSPNNYTLNGKIFVLGQENEVELIDIQNNNIIRKESDVQTILEKITGNNYIVEYLF